MGARGGISIGRRFWDTGECLNHEILEIHERARRRRFRRKRATTESGALRSATPYLGPVEAVFHTFLSVGREFLAAEGPCFAHRPYIYKVIERDRNLAGGEGFSDANGVD